MQITTETIQEVTDITTLDIKKIAVFRALKLGDFLVAVPALRALRAAFPDATIDYIGLPMIKELAERFDAYIDNFIEFAGFPGLPEKEYSSKEVIDFLQTMQRQNYDLVLQLHGKGTIVNPMVSLFGGKLSAGFASSDAFCPNEDTYMQYPAKEKELIKLLQMLNFLGIPSKGDQMEFPVNKEDYRRLTEIPEYQNVKGKGYVCIHPGASSSTPWPASYFAEVADVCAAQGLSVVFTGTATESELVKEATGHMKYEAINMAGKTDLGTLAALLKESTLVVSQDTGVAHMAVAVDALSITVFTTADPTVWAAIDQTRHIAVSADDATQPKTISALAKSLLKEERMYSS